MSTKYTKPVIRIQHDQPSRGRWWLILLLLGVLGASAFGYYQGNDGSSLMGKFKSSPTQSLDSGQPRAGELEALKTKNNELISQLAKLERNKAIDETASVTTQQGLVAKEKQIKKLEEELSFYKSIVNPASGETGLTIHSFKLTQGKAPGTKQFHLVMTHIGGGGKDAKGTVVLRLQGMQDGAEKILEWWDIRADKGEQMPAFKFKYFQRIKGLINVPETFSPTNILVKVIPESTKLNSSQQSYTWTAVNKVVQL